jgi:RNA polymerase-binding transcription factor DksA
MSTAGTQDWPHLKRLLQKQHEDLRKAIHSALIRRDDERYQNIAGAVHDAEEQSVADLLTDINLAEISRELQELRDVEAALQRMTLGTFGRCVSCREPIERERLQAHPSATRCLRCQQQLEQSPARRPPPSV